LAAERAALAPEAGTYLLTYSFERVYDFKSVCWAFGDATLSGNFSGLLTVHEDGTYEYSGSVFILFNDRFKDPYDTFNLFPIDIEDPRGTPYNIFGGWEREYSGNGTTSPSNE
jgi:hypothetical protein